jgi:hypothetical protein
MGISTQLVRSDCWKAVQVDYAATGLVGAPGIAYSKLLAA